MKVLIISHNPITSYHNMGKTLRNLFSDFSKDELCQLYCYPTLPDIDCCDSYYRITDLDVLRSFWSFFRVRGRRILQEEIRPDNTLYEHAADRKHFHVTQDSKRILRDIMWRFSRWDSWGLWMWLLEQQPDCIFVAPGDACFLYDIALAVAEKLGIPIVAYLCDDYLFIREKQQFWRRIRFALLKRKMRSFFRKVSHCIYICNEMQTLYIRELQLPGALIMTGTEQVAQRISSHEKPSVITYMGNICCNRYHSLTEIGRELDRINDELHTDFRLHVYTDEKDPVILGKLQKSRAIKLFGFLQGESYRKVFSGAQLLLHTEAFDDDSKDLVKCSVSTKIAECLASGIPLLAYGPEEVASMGHLMRNDCAITATSKEMLHDALLTALLDGNRRKCVAENGLQTARKYHDSKECGRIVRKILQEHCKESALVFREIDG